MCSMLIKYSSRDPKVPIVILSINNNNLLVNSRIEYMNPLGNNKPFGGFIMLVNFTEVSKSRTNCLIKYLLLNSILTKSTIV